MSPMTKKSGERSVSRCIVLLKRGYRAAVQVNSLDRVWRRGDLAHAWLRCFRGLRIAKEVSAVGVFDSILWRVSHREIAYFNVRGYRGQPLFVRTVAKAVKIQIPNVGSGLEDGR